MNNLQYNQALFERVHGNLHGASDRMIARITGVADRIPLGVRTILDLGAGRCYLSNLLLERGYQVTSLDLVRQSLKNARSPRVQGNGAALPFRDGSFDIVVCTEVVEHLQPDVRCAVLRESWRVTSQYVLIAVPNDEDLNAALVCCNNCGHIFHAWGHLTSFNTKSMETLFPLPPSEISVHSRRASRYFPPLLFIRQKILKTYGYDTLLVCPACFYTDIQPPHRSLSVKVLDRINYWLRLEKEAGWLLALYDKKRNHAAGTKVAREETTKRI